LKKDYDQDGREYTVILDSKLVNNNNSHQLLLNRDDSEKMTNIDNETVFNKNS